MHPVPKAPVGIDPRVDCVFKALLGDPAHPAVLLDFLNAVVAPEVPITGVSIRNPAHLPDFIGDDFTVVDVEATDAKGNIFQVEMQSWNEAALKERVLYTWADLFEGQLVSGDDYSLLKPVIAIWVLNRNILRNAPRFHHRFTVCDAKARVQLTGHLQIHTLELLKWRPGAPENAALERWMHFFTGAVGWAEVPPALWDPVMEEAMDILENFKREGGRNATYRARMDFWRSKVAQEKAHAAALEALEKTQMELQKVEAERQKAEAERQKAEEELDRLRALLAARAGGSTS